MTDEKKRRTVTDEQGQVWECWDSGCNKNGGEGFERLVECRRVPATHGVAGPLFGAPTGWMASQVLGDEKLLEKIGGGL